jgi:sortase (surface protein transpeptidase)
MELKRKTKLRISNSNNILRYENNNTLNIEKSLRKKLESTKRPEIVVVATCSVRILWKVPPSPP